MSAKTLKQLSDESGISLMRVTVLLKNVTPEVVLGRTKGYHPDALRAALVNKYEDELRYLNVLDSAAYSMPGYGSQD